jgi:hypothetical protein
VSTIIFLNRVLFLLPPYFLHNTFFDATARARDSCNNKISGAVIFGNRLGSF